MALVKCRECGAKISTEAKVCPQCGVAKPDRTSVGTWLAIIIGVMVAYSLGSAALEKSAKEKADVATAAAAANAAAVRRSKEATDCSASIESRKSQYVKQLDAKKYWDAALALGDCPNILKDKTLIDMQLGARRLSFIETASDPKAPIDARLTAIGSLNAYYPADAAQFEKTRLALQAQADKASAADAKRVADAERKRRRSEGVNIGMTKEEALQSSWGKPESVNRTTNVHGTIAPLLQNSP